MTSQPFHKHKNNTVEKWVQIYYRDLFVWAKYRTGNTPVAEDLVQDTFLAAWKGFNNFKSDGSPKSWLFQILNHKIADYFRKSYQLPLQINPTEAQLNVASLFDAYGNWQPNGFEKNWESPNLMDNMDFTNHLSTCIGNLPEQWATIITDKYLNGKKSEIICQENNISTTNYWQIIHRAKLILKNCLEKFFLA